MCFNLFDERWNSSLCPYKRLYYLSFFMLYKLRFRLFATGILVGENGLPPDHCYSVAESSQSTPAGESNRRLSEWWGMDQGGRFTLVDEIWQESWGVSAQMLTLPSRPILPTYMIVVWVAILTIYRDRCNFGGVHMTWLAKNWKAEVKAGLDSAAQHRT